MTMGSEQKYKFVTLWYDEDINKEMEKPENKNYEIISMNSYELFKKKDILSRRIEYLLRLLK